MITESNSNTILNRTYSIGTEVTENKNNLVLAIAGGDGTLLWVTQVATEQGLVLNDGSLSFCILPFGTGNDLSQTMGWGKVAKPIWTVQVERLALNIINA